VAEKTPPSPESLQLRGAPLSSARLSKKAALAAVAIVAVILGVIIVNVSKESPKQGGTDNAAKKDLEPALNAGQSLTKDVPDIVAAPPESLPPVVPRTPAAAHVRSSADEARLADSAIPKFSATESTGIQPAVAGMSVDAASQNYNTGGNPPVRPNGLPGAVDGGPANEPDLNHQAEKLGFLEKRHQSAYINARLAAPLSPFELKTGTVIPSILISAMNSDLPGEIIAQVSQNVYDTASGNHLLIPQGTRLFGRYDSRVTFGQDRLLVSWERLIYPNAYTLELGGMSGTDQEGTSGFADRVNNHYGRIFGWALLTSVLSAGAQLSQPQQTSILATPGSGQVAAAAVGQQMAQLGSDIARRNLQVQPTIEIRKGYRLNVMVNKDVVFPGSYEP
jgi:type IV secretion system protein TrbI